MSLPEAVLAQRAVSAYCRGG